MNHLDLFSGIGGFALAARMNGLRTVAFVERDAYAQKVLRKNFAGVPIYDDICTFDGKPWRGVWLLTGGFPCQPYSLAGKRRGASDDRALWPEMLRVIAEANPRWVLGENVPGIISVELDSVLADLERLNYSAWALTVPACAVDARHRRDRVWIVAHAHDAGRPQQRGAGSNGPEYETSQRCSRWLPEPELGRVAHGIPDRVDRLRGLGNAIVPQVAAEIIRSMLAV